MSDLLCGEIFFIEFSSILLLHKCLWERHTDFYLLVRPLCKKGKGNIKMIYRMIVEHCYYFSSRTIRKDISYAFGIYYPGLTK